LLLFFHKNSANSKHMPHRRVCLWHVAFAAFRQGKLTLLPPFVTGGRVGEVVVVVNSSATAMRTEVTV